ncbi:MAG: putative Ig domain-containing protein [Acidobacteriota bacterium]|nr:putative Ig domain-containing protein [Acidobacteriota bacterium]
MRNTQNPLTQRTTFFIFFICLLVSNVPATDIFVTTDSDRNTTCVQGGNPDCSLREAIASAAATGDTIKFSSFFNSSKTITLTNGQLVIGKTLTIQGPGPNFLTVSGNNASRVFHAGFSSGRTVTISGMKITGGAITDDLGAGVFNGNGIILNLTDVIISNNMATSTSGFFAKAQGGGVVNHGGQLNITNSIISNNQATGASSGEGGGVYNSNLTVNGLNQVTINNSIVSGNTSKTQGGGISNNGQLIVTNSTISNNQTTGANGGGIHTQTSATITTTIENTTISGNSSNNAGGGILCGQGVVTITNSTISGNTTVFGGAGIEKQNQQAFTLINVTVTNNTATNGSSSGGGIRGANGPFTTRNSIFAGNNAVTNPDVMGTFTSQGYNLVGVVGTATGFTSPGDQTGSAANPLNAKLAPLGNYGGATMTHALLKNSNPSLNSPAIDAADPANPPATDQRGVSRPQDGDNNNSSRADIGAFEVVGASSNYAATLPSGIVSQSGYSVTIAADNVQNGVTYNYCISGGQLPPGLSGINPCPSQLFEEYKLFSPQAAVVISGTPTQTGTYNFTVRAFDSNGNAIETNYTLTVTAPQACVAPPSGMVGWYAGDGNANDISGVHNNGAFFNGATTAPGMVGQAFSFDGVNDYVEMPSLGVQDPQVAATLDAWVKFNQTPSQAGRIMEIITKGDFGNDLDLAAMTDDKFVLFIRGGSFVKSTTVIQSNVWYHVAATWNSSELRMYVNGVLENTTPLSNVSRTVSTVPLRIGNGYAFDRNQLWFSGLIDEVEIFNRALSATEILAIYNAQSAGKCKGAPTNVISGRVIYALDTQKGVSGVAVSATGTTSANVTTDRAGAYLLENLTGGGQYIVTITKSGGANGITAFDATLVLRHVAAGGTGPNALNASQQLAADTDGSNDISAFDATQILRYVAANGPNANTGQAGNWILTPTSKTYGVLNNPAFDENYTAILIGEISGDYIAP